LIRQRIIFVGGAWHKHYRNTKGKKDRELAKTKNMVMGEEPNQKQKSKSNSYKKKQRVHQAEKRNRLNRK